MKNIHYYVSLIFMIFTIIYGQTSITSLKCRTEHECIGQSIVVDYLHAQGFQSAYGPNTSFEGYGASCLAAESCKAMSFIKATWSVECKGESSCADVSSFKANIIYCLGEDSCKHASLKPLIQLDCDGLASCAETNINGTNPRETNINQTNPQTTINARGMLSLYKANITASSNIIVNLQATLAGYNTRLECPDGNSCQINCNTLDACENLICNGQCSGIVLQTSTHLQNFTYYIPQLFVHSDTQCLVDANNADAVNEGYRYTIANSSDEYCCRGYFSCHSVTVQSVDLICSSEETCSRSTIMSIDILYFKGSASGRYSTISTLNEISILLFSGSSAGYRTEAQLYTNSIIVCSGRQSCWLQVLKLNFGEYFVYFTGTFSGERTIIECFNGATCNLFCMGYDSCNSMHLRGASNAINIYCDYNVAKSCAGLFSTYSAPNYISQILWPESLISNPTYTPTDMPTYVPTFTPTNIPTEFPTAIPTDKPTDNPTEMETTEMETTDFVNVSCLFNTINNCGARTFIDTSSGISEFQSVELKCDLTTNQLALLIHNNLLNCNGYSYAIPFGDANNNCSCDDIIILSYNVYSSSDCSGQPHTLVTDYPESISKQGNLCEQYPIGECKTISTIGSGGGSGSQMMNKCEKVYSNNIDMTSTRNTDDNDILGTQSSTNIWSIQMVIGVVLVDIVCWMV